MMTSVNKVCVSAVVWMNYAMALVFATLPLPKFSKLKEYYPGYKHHGGYYRNNKFINLIGVSRTHLLHDTSALRLSYTLNKLGGLDSLGKDMIHLSKYGTDSVVGSEGMQFIFHPIAFGPYLADKYGYPNVSKVHATDPLETKRRFWGKQGLVRILTYTKHGNIPNGHVALWDCTHFHQSPDWLDGHVLITVEFWKASDSVCPTASPVLENDIPMDPRKSAIPVDLNSAKKLRMDKYMQKLYQTYYQTSRHKPDKMQLPKVKSRHLKKAH